jgi:hypothetical protein
MKENIMKSIRLSCKAINVHNQISHSDLWKLERVETIKLLYCLVVSSNELGAKPSQIKIDVEPFRR